MQIRAALLPELATNTASSVSIVIDALRATTVAAVMFEAGAPVLYAAPSHDFARRFARSRGYLLCGESGGQKVPDFDYGNSPVEFSSLNLTDKPAVLSTTNGTRAIAAVHAAPHVLLGAAVNRMAVARAAWYLAQEQDLDIEVVCSGTNGQFTLEDATVAGLFVEALGSFADPWTLPEIADSAVACRRLWQKEPNMLRGWMEGAHAHTLANLGFGEDVAYCAQIDRLQTVPRLTTEQGAQARDVHHPVVLVTEELISAVA
jgi:2-phosphosulfolactate phosphatase